jgi:hypothetical protein
MTIVAKGFVQKHINEHKRLMNEYISGKLYFPAGEEEWWPPIRRLLLRGPSLSLTSLASLGLKYDLR